MILPYERIAIIGVGGVFPGAGDLATFWRNVADGIDSGRPAPAERWYLAPERAVAAGSAQPDRVYSTWGCFIEALEPDFSGLRIDPADLVGLDPLFSIGLHAAAMAWRDARQPQVDPLRAGAILGHIVLPTESTSGLARDVLLRAFAERLLKERTPEWQASGWSPRNWQAAGLPAAILSAALGFQGPSFTLDAACASSLYAVKLACEELHAGRADVMLAGGLSRPDCQYTQMGFAQLQALSKGGRCAPLSGEADGLVVGEGAGLFVLKRVSDALRDGDHIYATIAGIGLSNDRGANLLAPHSEGQLRAMRAAYDQAGWQPEAVDLIECHATGTPVGDAVELESLHGLWGSATGRPRRCVLGSVKSNVGHLLTAAGGASLMKILWALKTATLPPTANYREPAAALQSSDSPFRVLSAAEPWETRGDHIPRRAAINAFGFGGINAHVLLEEWSPEPAGSQSRSAFPASPVATPSDIAIVGVAAHIGPWQNTAAVQRRLFHSDHTPPQPHSGWGIDSPVDHPGGFAIDAIQVPVAEFRIPPLELEEMLPQQQLMLQVASSALDDADTPRDLGDRTGVFVGIGLDPNTTNFHCRWAIEEYVADWAARLGRPLGSEELNRWTRQLRDAFGPPLTANRVMGNLGGIVASRLGREFDVGGPCFTISSDEASGIQALDIAIRALQRGELDQALVGAVDLPSDIRLRLSDSEPEPYADGAIAFVLKRRSDAERDGQRIYAILPGERGDLGSPRDVAAQESSGELSPSRPLNCGAVTSLVPVLHATLSLFQQIDPQAVPQPWLRDRATAVRSLSVPFASRYGRTRLLLEEAGQIESPRSLRERRRPLGELSAAIFVVTGDTVDELRAGTAELAAFVTADLSLERLARSWFQHRPPNSAQRLARAYVASSVAELNSTLKTDVRGGESRSGQPSASQFPSGRLAFVFPGSGNHFLGMGRELLTAFPEVLRRQDAENERQASQYRPDIIWNGVSTEAIGRDHKAMIFGQVALGTAICDWLADFGVRPHAAIGYSLGESAALFGLRAWRDRDEMLRRMEASPLFGSDLTRPYEAARKAWNVPEGVEVPWLSGVIDRSAAVVRPAIERWSRVYLLIVNTPTQCVIGGDRSEVESLVAELGATFVPLPAPSTVHCRILKEVSPAYVELHLLPTTPPAGVDFYSGATGKAYGLSRDAAAGAILAQAIDTVDFPRVIQSAYRDGVRLFLEIGPGSSCTKMIDEILGDSPHWARAVCPATADPVRHALQVLAELIELRVPVDLSVLYASDATAATNTFEASARYVVTPTQGRPWDLPDLPDRERAPQTAGTPRTTPAAKPVSRAPAVVTTSPLPHTLQSPTPRSQNVIMPAPRPLGQSSTAPSAPTHLAASNDPILRAWDRWMTERSAAHEAFLRFSSQAHSLAADLISTPPSGLAVADEGIAITDRERLVPADPETRQSIPETPPRALNYEQCLEYAIGKIGNVLGPMFAEIDEFPTRVRLPDVPLMLVDRILSIEGEPLSMTQGRVVTEHDIHDDDWYLDCGRIPTCLAVESGQADLFLSGWLGIDVQTRGLACYRLLDAVVTFQNPLPGPGQTIHYDIRIIGFFRQGETYLFRFEFDATVAGQPLLTMREGVAGFFTQQALAAGQGIIHTALDKQPRPGKRPDDWDDPVPLRVESYDDAQLAALRAGDLAGCFGPAFDQLPLRQPVTLPSGRLNLVHRVLQLDPVAGKFGLGQIRAEADIHPDDWFLTCHFCDDQVMPGTLMYECCLHTLRIYLLRMGWIGEAGEIAYEPVPGIKSRLKCRGQVLASTQKVWYEVTLKEIGYEGVQSSELRVQSSDPRLGVGSTSALNSAYAIADALMYADGKPIVEISDMSVRLSGLTRADVERLWSGSELRAKGLETDAATSASSSLSLNPQLSTLDPLFDTDRITAFAIGKPSDAFGDRYRAFDEERKIARLPGPPFQFLDRIVSIQDCQPWVLEAGGTIVAEYDVPPDAWYFAANRSTTMPFAVLLETALQPCGWLAGYLGSALTSEVDLSFRNLGGKATQFQPVTPESGTLSTTVKITRVSQSAGMIIQHYDYELRCNGEPVYVGNTYFGFFAKAALANQVGIRDAAVYQPTPEELARARAFPVSLEPPFPDDRFCMVRRVDALVLDGGPHGLGYVRGSVDVDPDMWFFKAHFYQDPVWPGSLGLESFLQLLKIYCVERWGRGLRAQGSGPENAAEPPSSLSLSPQHLALGTPHEWIYRGQVIPRDKTVTVDVVVTQVNDTTRTVTASGFLTVDGRVIYQMIDFRWQAS